MTKETTAKGVTTRRIRRRAAEWKALTRPSDTAEQVALHLTRMRSSMATGRTGTGNPPLSPDAIAAQIGKNFAAVFAQVRDKSRRTPATIGYLRNAYAVLAAAGPLLASAPRQFGDASPYSLACGDLVLHEGIECRVINSAGGRGGHRIETACGAVIEVKSGAHVLALRPADRDAFEQRRRAQGDAAYKRTRARADAAIRAFDDAYTAAIAAGCWPAVQRACDALRRAWPYEQPRSTIKARIRMLTDGPADRREGGGFRRWGTVRRGFKSHVAAEKELQRRRDVLAAIPGFDPNDRRDVVPVKTGGGKIVKVCGASLRGDRSMGDWVRRVNDKGQIILRGRNTTVGMHSIVEIVPAKVRKPKAVAPAAQAPAETVIEGTTIGEWRETDARLRAIHDADEASAKALGNERLANIVAHRRREWAENLAHAEAAALERVAA